MKTALKSTSSGLFLILGSILFICRSSQGDVILGEMLHGSNYRKRVTLRNVGETDVQLSNFGLNVYLNVPGDMVYRLDSISTEAVIKPSGNYSICHTSSDEECDIKWGGLNFNGNDAIELVQNGSPIDRIGDHTGHGIVGCGWTVADIPEATCDHLLIRKASISSGDLDWEKSSQNEWIVQNLSPKQNLSCPLTKPVFDDSCWEIRSKLSSFNLDTCEKLIEKSSAVIGTYNTRFLFDGIGGDKERETPEEAGAHLKDIANVIRRNAPDILTLAEIEDLEILQKLIKAIEESEYTPVFVQGRDTATGQDMGQLLKDISVYNASRTDCRSGWIEGTSCGVCFSGTNGVSKNLITLFDSCLFGHKFAMVSIHLYAFPTDPYRCAYREAQARVIQDVIVQLMEAGFEVIVLGDFNDYSDLYEDTLKSQNPISHVLSMIRDPNGDDVDELFNVMQLLPESERYTSWWDIDEDEHFDGITETSMIDHILMTEGLFSRILNVWIDHEPNPEIVSDHWPYFVELSTAHSQNTKSKDSVSFLTQ